MTYQEYIKHEIKVWEQIVVPAILPFLPKELTVYDIGCSYGAGLIALRKTDPDFNLFGIEKNAKKLFETKLKPLGFAESYLSDFHIQLMEIDGNDPSVLFSDATLIIKTFNLSVSWKDVLKKKEPQFLLTHVLDPITSNRYKLIQQINGEPNIYFLYKHI